MFESSAEEARERRIIRFFTTLMRYGEGQIGPDWRMQHRGFTKGYLQIDQRTALDAAGYVRALEDENTALHAHLAQQAPPF